MNGRTYAFVAIERAGGGTMAFDITDPGDVSFTTYARTAGDISPEGTLFIPGSESPNGQDLLVLSNEVSNTVSIYQAQSNVPFTLQILHITARAGCSRSIPHR